MHLTLFMIIGCRLRGIHGALIAVVWIFILPFDKANVVQ